MNRLLLLVLSVLLVGCASQPRFDLNMSLSEASSMATEVAGSARQIESNRSFFSPFSSHTHIGVATTGPFDPYWSGSYEHRFLVGRMSGFDFGVSRYTLDEGYQLTYAARMDDHQFRVSVYAMDTTFQTDSAVGLENPYLIGFDFGVQALFPFEPATFAVGGQLTWATLAFDYQNALIIDGIDIYGDGLGIFGLGAPIGMILDFGPATFEAMITPTLYFHDSLTNVGFDNDIVFFNVAMPVNLSAGFRF